MKSIILPSILILISSINVYAFSENDMFKVDDKLIKDKINGSVYYNKIPYFKKTKFEAGDYCREIETKEYKYFILAPEEYTKYIIKNINKFPIDKIISCYENDEKCTPLCIANFPKEWGAGNVEILNDWLMSGFNITEAVIWKDTFGVTSPDVAHQYKEIGLDFESSVAFKKSNVNPEEAREWQETGLKNLNEINELIVLGIIKPSEARKWIDSGYDRQELIAWKKGDFTLDQASEWKAKSFNAKDALMWVSNGFNAEEALGWKASRRSPQVASAWKNGNFTLDQANEWRDKSFNAKDAFIWNTASFSPEESANWRDAGFSPDDARQWIASGFLQNEVSQWASYGLSSEEAVEYKKISISPSEANNYKNNGITASSVYLIKKYNLGIKELGDLYKVSTNINNIIKFKNNGISSEDLLDIENIFKGIISLNLSKDLNDKQIKIINKIKYIINSYAIDKIYDTSKLSRNPYEDNDKFFFISYYLLKQIVSKNQGLYRYSNENFPNILPNIYLIFNDTAKELADGLFKCTGTIEYTNIVGGFSAIQKLEEIISREDLLQVSN